MAFNKYIPITPKQQDKNGFIRHLDRLCINLNDTQLAEIIIP